jgi:methionyl-tRNA formyltransferase
LRIIFAGTPANAAATLQALLQSEMGLHRVVAVLTRPDAPVGRKRVITPSPVAKIAEAAGIPVIKTKRVDVETTSALAAFDADLGVVVAYGALLNAEALAVTTKGWINIHYSLLPLWRGAAPVQNALLSGDKTTGVTVFQLDEGMDTGPTWLLVPAEVQPDENAGELLQRLTGLGISALSQVLPEIAAGLRQPEPQVIGNEPLAVKPTREAARINFFDSAVHIERQVRAFNPEPVAYALMREANPAAVAPQEGNNDQGESLRILTARALGATDWASLGEGLEHTVGLVTIQKNRVLVHCGQGTLLELKEVQPAGKKPMAASDWARGLQNEVIFS